MAVDKAEHASILKPAAEATILDDDSDKESEYTSETSETVEEAAAEDAAAGFNVYEQNFKLIQEKLSQKLRQMMKSFMEKARAIQEAKESQRTHTKHREELSEAYQVFVHNSHIFGELPIPIIFRIKQGTLHVPCTNTIQEGVAQAMLFSLQNYDFLQI